MSESPRCPGSGRVVSALVQIIATRDGLTALCSRCGQRSPITGALRYARHEAAKPKAPKQASSTRGTLVRHETGSVVDQTARQTIPLSLPPELGVGAVEQAIQMLERERDRIDAALAALRGWE